MPLRSFADGEASFAPMVLMGIGYIILAGVMAAQLLSFLFVLAVCRRKGTGE